MMETAIGIFGGAIVAILTTITLEMLRRPKLRLHVTPASESPYPPGRPAKYGRYVRIDLVNEPLPGPFRWMSRSPALQCRGTISFHYLDGQRFLRDDMPVRFAHSPQPLPMEIVLGESRGVLVDPMRLSTDSRIDVYPGESTPLDVAVKFDDEDECYGWSNSNYLSNPPWRNSDWKLGRGRYLIFVTVSSSGQKCTGIFRLLNDGGPKEFRLELPLSADKVARL